jgi:hypothetical protein
LRSVDGGTAQPTKAAPFAGGSGVDVRKTAAGQFFQLTSPRVENQSLTDLFSTLRYCSRHSPRRAAFIGSAVMSKGMDRKKETKKKPTKTLEEKRAAKREKKANRG